MFAILGGGRLDDVKVEGGGSGENGQVIQFYNNMLRGRRKINAE